MRIEQIGAGFELLLALFEPLLGVAELGFEVGFLRGDLGGAAIEVVALLLQAVGELGGVLAELVDRVLDEAGAAGEGAEREAPASCRMRADRRERVARRDGWRARSRSGRCPAKGRRNRRDLNR